MDDTYIRLLIDLHRPNIRQGPGGEAETQKALMLAGLDMSRPLKIADIGCGTGASTLQLATELNAHITAVDFLPEFLDELQIRAQHQGIADRITCVNSPMDALPFAQGEFDVIWSEGAIYNMGFEAGVSAWKPFLKPRGKLVISEITWLTAERPAELQSHWDAEYPEVDRASRKIAILEDCGYRPEGYFYLSPSCWLENYYRPLQRGFDAFLKRHDASRAARDIIQSELDEISLYKKYSDYYSYGMYIAGK